LSVHLPETQDSQAVGYGQAGPTAMRMLLGARLRRLREAAGVSREDAGFAIRGSERLYYWNVLNRLVTEASPSADTEAILGQILREI
jgi:hypothetical protein